MNPKTKGRLKKAGLSLAVAGTALTILGSVASTAASASTSMRRATATPATIGTTVPTTAQAGYEAYNRDFRYISSTLTVPDTNFATGLYPQEYIQLSNGAQLSTVPQNQSGDQLIREGIESCTVAGHFGDTTCTPDGWVAFVDSYDNSLNGPFTQHYFNLAAVNQGDGVNFSIYYNAQGNELFFTITPPNTGVQPEQFYKTAANGAVFDHAAVIDDVTNSTGVPIALPPFISAFRVNQFLQGAITTGNGQKGSLVGPWTTSMVQATSNGLAYPSGTVRISPNKLWSDGLAANGMVRADDATGIWAR